LYEVFYVTNTEVLRL